MWGTWEGPSLGSGLSSSVRLEAGVLFSGPHQPPLDLDHDKMGLADRHQVWGLSACNQ